MVGVHRSHERPKVGYGVVSRIGPVKQPFSPKTYAALGAAEDRHFWFRARSDAIAAAVYRCVRQFPAGYTVLEVGCGTGGVLHRIESVCVEGKVSGVELEASGAEASRLRCNCEVVTGSIDDLDQERRFNLVAAFDVIEHVADDVALLASMASRIVEGGRVLLTVPAHPSLFSYWDVASGHYRRYSKSGLNAAIEAAGLHAEWMTPVFAALVPFAWARTRRRVARDVSADDVMEVDLRLPGRWANAAGYSALAWETFFIRHRLRVPFGSSYLVVATRGH